MTNNKALFMKWIQNLFYVGCIALAVSVISQIPVVGSWVSWITRVISIITIVILYKLIPLNERYQKAAIFMAASTIAGFLVSKVGLLLLVGSVCGFIATYQEYIGHSEVIENVDKKFSNNWRSLFHWELWGGLVLSFIVSGAITILSIINIFDVELLTNATQMILVVFNLVIQGVYVLLLKRMITIYTNYESPVEGVEGE